MVVEGGPYFMNRKQVIVKKWEVGFDFKKVILMRIPLWVRFHRLPIMFWNCDSLSRIGSQIPCALMNVQASN